MINGVIGDFINAALSAHVDELTKNAVNSNLFNNQLSISELQLYKYSLFQYSLPLIIKHGIIKNVQITIPFISKQDRSRIIISDVAIVATLCLGDPRQYINLRELYLLREHQLEAHELFKQKYKTIVKILSSDKIKGLSQKMMNDLAIEITNFHFRIELQDSAIGIFSDKIIFQSYQSKDNKIVQHFQLPKLCVYFDINSPRIKFKNNDHFLQKMRKLNKEKHTFLVQPFDFEAAINNDVDLVHLDSFLDALKFIITADHISLFMKISMGISKFMKMYEFIDIPMPYDKDPKKMWRYVHEAAKRKLKSPYQTFINAIYQIPDRIAYLKLWNKKQRCKEIEKLDHKLDYRTVILFRSISESLMKKKMDSIINWVDKDPLLLINGKINGVDLHVLAESICIQFSSKILGIRMNFINPELFFLKTEVETKVVTVLSSFNIEYSEKKKVFSIFKSIYNEDYKLTIEHKMKTKNNHVLSSSTQITSEIPDYCIDLQHLLHFISQIDIETFNQWRSSTKASDSTFSMKMLKTRFIWVFSQSQMIDFGFNQLNVNVQNENSIQLLISEAYATTQNYILEHFSIQASLMKKRLNIKINPFKINIGQHEIELATPFIKYLSLFKPSTPKNELSIHVMINSIEVRSEFIPDQCVQIVHLSIKMSPKSKSVTFESFAFSQFINLEKFKVILGEDKNVDLTLNSSTITLSKIPTFTMPNLEQIKIEYQNSIANNQQINENDAIPNPQNNSNENHDKQLVTNNDLIPNSQNISNENNDTQIVSNTDPNLQNCSDENDDKQLVELLNDVQDNRNLNIKFNCVISQLFLNIFEIDVNLTNLQVNTGDTFSFKFDSISSSFIEFSKNSSIFGVFDYTKKLFKLTLNFDSINVDVDPLLDALTVPSQVGNNVNATFPKIKSPITFKIKSPMFPVTIKQGNKKLSCGADLSVTYSNEGVLNIKLRKSFFKLNEIMIFENLAVALYRAPSPSKLTIALNENSIHLSLRIFKQIIEMFSQPNVTKFNPVDVICDFDVVIPKIELFIHAHSKNQPKLGPILFFIPITETRIHSHNLHLKYSTTFSVECLLSPLQSLQIVSQTTFIGKSNISPELIESKMEFDNPLDVFISPYSLNAMLHFNKNSQMASDFLFVNQTGMLISFVVDGETFKVKSNSGKLNQHYPINPTIEINFPQVSEKNSFDISILRRENSYSMLVDGGYVMMQMNTRSLTLSSILSFHNLTSKNILIDVPNIGLISIETGDTVFLPPKFCQIRTVNVMVNETQKTVQIIKKRQFLEFDHFFIIVNYDIDPISLISTITFNSPFYLQSFYPQKLNVAIKNWRFEVYTSRLYPIDLISPSTGSLTIEISSENTIGKSKLKIRNANDFSILKTETEKDQPIFLFCQTIEKNGYKIFQLSAEVFLFNQLGLSLGIAREGTEFVSPKNKIVTPNVFETKFFTDYKHVLINDPNPFVFTSSSTDEFTLRLMLLYSKKECSDKVYISNKVNTNSFLTLPASPATDDVMPISIITSHPIDHPNTTFLYIRPAFFIINKSQLPLFVKLSETNNGLIPPNNYLSVSAVDPKLNVDFILMNTVFSLNLLTDISFSILLNEYRSMIVETMVFDSIKYFTFKTEDYRRSYIIINETDVKFGFCQKGCKYQYVVEPYSALLFDLSDSRLPYLIYIEAFDLTIDLELPSESIINEGPTNGIYYTVNMGPYNKNMFVIRNEYPTHLKKDYHQKILFNLGTSICHLASHSSRELCQLSLFNINVQLEEEKEERSAILTVDAIQMDDMNENATFPVVFAGYSLNNKPFISFAFQRFSIENIGLIILELQPIIIKLDLSFIGDLIGLFSSLRLKKIEKKFSKTEKKDLKYIVQLLRIYPISLDITFNGHTERENNSFYNFTFPHFTSLIPNIDSLDISFDTFESTYLSVNKRELMLYVGDHFQSQLKSQWLSIIGSVALFGSPQKLFKNFKRSFSSLIQEKNLKYFMQGTVGTIIATPETCLKTASSSFRMLTNDYSLTNTDETAMGSLKWATKSLAYGLSKAVTGIVTKPINQKGVTGVMKGVGQGVLGVFTNTVGGILDFSSGVLGGVRIGLFGHSILERINQPIRFQLTDSNSNDDEILYWDRNVQIYKTIVRTNDTNILIKDIKHIERKENKVKLIEIDDKKQTVLKFKNINMAKEFCDLVKIQNERNNFLTFLDFIYPEQ